MTALAGPAPLPARRHRWRGGPPGILFYVATIAGAVLALDANSRGSLGALLLAVPLWLALAVVWLIRFVTAARRTRLRMSATDWFRWLAIPIVMGFVFLVTRTDAVVNARFDLSRGSMDQVATEVMSGGSTDPGWVGLYDVSEVQATANGMRFVIEDNGFSRRGFAYSPDGEPVLTEENYSPIWTDTTFKPAGGNWWFWSESWD
jgi:hypothetical protein